ncbi:MAG: M36 family metallopeptidase [Thermoleophilaceae bacterium]|nr:M36 family metallopeptidase [Thermoleophilaceae bacterium]
MTALRSILIGAAAGSILLVASPAIAADPHSGLADEVDAPVAELEPESSRRSLGVTFDRYRQEVDGVPVLDSEVLVVEPAGERPRVVADRTRRAVQPAREATVSRRRAVAIAHEAIGMRAERAPTQAGTGIDARGGRDRLVWEVLVPSQRPLGDFRVLVGAWSGEVLSTRNLAVSVRGRARLFVPNPIVENFGVRDGLADARDADSAKLTALRSSVVLSRLRGGSKCLEGTFAVVQVRARKVCSRSRDWRSLTRSDAEFEGVMSYFHIDRAAAYIRSLGIGDATPRRLRVIANGISDDNSFFLPIDRSITFGSGGVDDAEDGDVIVHEYGHAVQDAQGADFRDREEGKAIGEGFGDYLAAAMTAETPGTSGEDAACVFDWDTLSLGLPCLRRTDLGGDLVSLDPACRADFHCVGQLWSSALWRLRGLFADDGSGKSVMDRVVLQSNFALPTGAGLRAAAEALLGADEQLYDGLHRAEIEAELTARGFL